MKEQQPTKANMKIKRGCLKCKKMFPSSSKHNRICKYCKEQNTSYGEQAEGVLDL